MTKLAIALLQLPNGEFMFQRRTDDAPTSPGLLGCFGGHIEPQETPQEAVVRELGEETDLELEDKDFKLLLESDVPGRGEEIETHSYVFLAHVATAEFKVFEGKWSEAHSLDQLLSRGDVAHTTRYLLECIIEKELI